MSAIECRYRVEADLLAAAVRAAAEVRGRPERPKWLLAGAVVVGLGAGAVLGMVLSGSGLRLPWQGVAGFVLGAAVIVALWQATWSRQLRRVAAAHEAAAEAAGDVVSRFGPEGIESRSALGQSFNHWGAVTGIFELHGGTALRVGASAMPVPDAALPEGMSGKVFRAALDGWRRVA